MSRRALLTGGLVAVVIVAVAAGLSRVRIDTDVFSLLPQGITTIEALRLQEQAFGGGRELLVVVRAHEPEVSAAAAAEVAATLDEPGTAAWVVHGSPTDDGPEVVGELTAYLWLNAEPSRFAALAGDLAPGAVEARLGETRERLAASLDPGEVGRLARDPLGLTAVLEDLGLAGGVAGQEALRSADGRMGLVIVGQPEERTGFLGTRRWVEEVRERAEGAVARLEGAGEAGVELTGYPALATEVGWGLLRDVTLAGLGTLALVALLFMLVHRSARPAAWLLGLLVGSVLITVSLATVVLGPLFAVSLAFGAILLGLAADYGLILYQEAAAGPDRAVAEHRRAVAPSILWAAATTAVAFLMVSLSSLPGLSQLGVLVAIGLLVSACLMLLVFLPPLAARQGRVATRPSRRLAAHLRVPGRLGWGLSAAVLVIAGAVVAVRPPEIDTSPRALGPQAGEARAVLDDVEAEIGGFEARRQVIVAGSDPQVVRARLDRVGAIIAGLEEEGLVAAHELPLALWPDPAAQRENRARAGELAGRLEGVEAAAREAGFRDEALALTREVFAAWGRFAEDTGVSVPRGERARWLFRQFASTDDRGRALALGSVELREGAGEAEASRLQEALAGLDEVWVADWTLAAGALLEAMRADLVRVLLPAGVILVVMLALAFRAAREVVLSLSVLALTAIGLTAVMGLAGWSWNLMNVMALPLLLGAAVDYSIHVQLALRRLGGDIERMRETVGQAVLLCGTSTAIAFGTLGLASNAGLASLGRVCAVGVVIAMLVSLVLLPVWWRGLSGAAGARQEVARP